jgi:hypothetical protein
MEDENIVRLDVKMHHAVQMNVLQCLGDIPEDPQQQLLVEYRSMSAVQRWRTIQTLSSASTGRLLTSETAPSAELHLQVKMCFFDPRTMVAAIA